MANIAVIGAGAIGSTVAAWIDQGGGHHLTLCVRSPVTDLRIDTPSGPISARPVVRTDPAAATPVEWVLVATKAYDVAGTAHWLARLVGADTRVAVLQNGVEHRARFAGLVPDDRIVPVIVDIPAERTAPGRVRQRRIGSMLVPDDDAGRAFVALMASTPFAISVSDDFTTAAWRKLAVNCAGAVNALALRPAGIAARPEVAEVMRGLVAECVAVGRSVGANLPDTLPDEIVAGARAGSPDGINSLHADRLAGRPMEWDARNGVIVRLGRVHGIATPLNQMAAALLEAAEG
jgi:2-dehydropantoate 2-reductase